MPPSLTDPPPPDALQPWEHALDQPGTADAKVLRRVTIFTACIVVMAVGVLAFGQILLPAFPQFATFHAGFVFLVDAITGFMLLGQFRYRRLPLYAMLASAYLFTSLVSVFFALSFPGALKAEGSVIGDAQSSIWVWHFWHMFFPAIIALSLMFHQRSGNIPVPGQQVFRLTIASMAGAAGLAAAVAVVITEFHDFLPPLISPSRIPLYPYFYVAGGLAAAVTAFAAFLAWQQGLRQRTILHLWLAVSLTAFLADIAASLGATARFSFAWYFGRVESMLAASTLLLVFLNEINRLYRQLTASMGNLSRANEKLAALVDEKEQLVAELRSSEEEIRQLAFYDVLTHLPNRRLLLDRLNQALSQAKRHGYAIAVMYLDLDHFKEINDTFGHDTGDELLQQVAVRLADCIRSGDTMSRSGGDEFILVMTEISQPHDAALVAEKMIQSLNEPILVRGHQLGIGVSIGIAIYPVDSTDDMQDLMRKADVAMYAAKDSGRNSYRFYGDVHPVRDSA